MGESKCELCEKLFLMLSKEVVVIVSVRLGGSQRILHKRDLPKILG